jgi:hypothetical protein
MGRTAKASIAFGISLVLVAYFAGLAYIDSSYNSKIKVMERDLELYEMRKDELLRQQISFEVTRLTLMEQLGMQQEASNAQQTGDTAPPQPALSPPAPSVGGWQAAQDNQPAVLAQQGNSALAQQIKRLSAVGGGGSSGSSGGGSTPTRRVTRAS